MFSSAYQSDVNHTRMALYQNSLNVLHLLHGLKPKNGKEIKELDDLISLLEDPIFQKILSINDSLQNLKFYIENYKLPHLSPDDFDITLDEGLLISPRIAEIIESHRDIKPGTEQSSFHKPQDDLQSPLDKTLGEGEALIEKINVKLFRPENSSLGLSILGLQNEANDSVGVFVKDIDPNGTAGRNGQLREGDQILAINGVKLRNVSHKDAISLLQNSKGTLELLVGRNLQIRSSSPSQSPNHDFSDSHQHDASITEDGTAPLVTPPTIPYNLQQQRLSLDIRARPEEISFSIDDKMVLDSEWAEMELIELKNEGSGLGFGIVGGKSTGVVVKSILTGGIAYKDRRLRNNDHILQIGDVNLRGMSSDQVASVLRHCGSPVKLVVAREILDIPSPTNHPNSLFLPTKLLNEQLGMDILPSQIIANKSILPEEPENLTESSIESFEESTTFERTLAKGPHGLGMTIAGYIGEEISGIFVKSIAPDSPADLDGNIKINDQIIEVDGKSLIGVNNQDSVEVLKNTSNNVHLKFIRYLKGSKHDQLENHTEHEEPPIPAMTPDMKEFNEPITITHTGADTFPSPTLKKGGDMMTAVAQQDFDEREHLLLPMGEEENEVEEEEPILPPVLPSKVRNEYTASTSNGVLPTLLFTAAPELTTTAGKGLIPGIMPSTVGSTKPIISPKPFSVSSSSVSSSVTAKFITTSTPTIISDANATIFSTSPIQPSVMSSSSSPVRSVSTASTTRLQQSQPPIIWAPEESGGSSRGALTPSPLLLRTNMGMYQGYGAAPPPPIVDPFEAYLHSALAQYDDDDEESREYARKWLPLLTHQPPIDISGPPENFYDEGIEIVVAEFDKFKKGGGLGISLEGTVDVQEDGTETRPHHYIRSILPDGPLGLNGKLKSGDELLEVNGQVLYGKNHREVVKVLKETPLRVKIVCARVNNDLQQMPFFLEGGGGEPGIGETAAREYGFGQSKLPLGSGAGGIPFEGVMRPVSYDFTNFSRSSSQTPPVVDSQYMTGKAPPPFHYPKDSSERLFKAKSEGALSIGGETDDRNLVDSLSGTSTSISASVATTVPPPYSLRHSKSLEPIHGLATWSNEVFPVYLKKTDREGLGFSILDYQDPNNDPRYTVIVIRSLVPGGQAAMDGSIVPGDRLVFVNEVSLLGLSLDSAVLALKQAPSGTVCLGISKPIPLEEGGSHMIDQTILGTKHAKTLPKDVPPSYFQHDQQLKRREISQGEEGGEKILEEPSLMFKAEPAVEYKPKLAIQDQSAYLKDSLSTLPSDQSSSVSPLPLIIPPLPYALERNIKIKKGIAPLGILLQTEEVGANGCIVTSVSPDGLVKKDGRIKVGDYITSINNESLRYVTPSQAKSILSRIALISGEISVNYIPCDDAAIHNQSAILAMQQHDQPGFTQGGQEEEPSFIFPVNKDKELQYAIFVDALMERLVKDVSAALKNGIPGSPAATSSQKLMKVKRDLQRGRGDALSETETLQQSMELSPETRSLEQRDIPLTLPFSSTPSKAMVPEISVPVVTTTRGDQIISDDLNVQKLPEKRESIKTAVQSPDQTSPIVTTATIHAYSEFVEQSGDIEDNRWSPPRLVELTKNENQSYGLSIVGGTIESDLNPDFDVPVAGIFIKNVFPNGPAFKNGQLKTGDRILEINNYKVSNSSLDEAVKIIRESKNRVEFLVQSLMGSNLIPYTFTFTPKKSEISNYSAKAVTSSVPPSSGVTSSSSVAITSISKTTSPPAITPPQTQFQITCIPSGTISPIPPPTITTPMAPTSQLSMHPTTTDSSTVKPETYLQSHIPGMITQVTLIETDFTTPSPEPYLTTCCTSPFKFTTLSSSSTQIPSQPKTSSVVSGSTLLSQQQTGELSAFTLPPPAPPTTPSPVRGPLKQRNVEQLKKEFLDRTTDNTITTSQQQTSITVNDVASSTKITPSQMTFSPDILTDSSNFRYLVTTLPILTTTPTKQTYNRTQPLLGNVLQKPPVEVLLGYSKPNNYYESSIIHTGRVSPYYKPKVGLRFPSSSNLVMSAGEIGKGRIPQTTMTPIPYQAIFPPITQYQRAVLTAHSTPSEYPNNISYFKFPPAAATTAFKADTFETFPQIIPARPSYQQSSITTTKSSQQEFTMTPDEIVYKISDNLERVTLRPETMSGSGPPSRRSSIQFSFPQSSTTALRNLPSAITDVITSPKVSPVLAATSPEYTSSLSSPGQTTSILTSKQATSLTTTATKQLSFVDTEHIPEIPVENDDLVTKRQTYIDVDGTKKTYIIEDETIRNKSPELERASLTSTPSSIPSSPTSE